LTMLVGAFDPKARKLVVADLWVANGHPGS
jgi:hypothetical protein